MLRSRRLEQLLGAPIADLTAAHLHAAVEARVVEGHDLDWKHDLYGGADSGKRQLSADVAALANTAGGLIVLGIAEDAHACAVAAPECPSVTTSGTASSKWWLAWSRRCPTSTSG
jgi:schlafen family protein